MNFKKILSFVCILLLVISAASCGDKDKEGAPSSSTTAKPPEASVTTTESTLPSGIFDGFEGPHDSSFDEIIP